MSFGDAFSSFILRVAGGDYLKIVHVPNKLLNLAKYRAWRAEEGEPDRWFYDLVGSNMTHTDPGGIMADCIVSGHNPVHWVATCPVHLVEVQILSYFANYWMPGDIVYNNLMQHRNPFRLFCVVMGKIDAYTCIIKNVDKCRTLHPGAMTLPIIMGVGLFNASSVFQMLDRRSRGISEKSFLAEPGSGVTCGVVCPLVYWYLGYGFQGGKHRDKAAVLLTLLFTVIGFLEDFFEFDAFAHLQTPIVALAKAIGRNYNPRKKIAVP